MASTAQNHQTPCTGLHAHNTPQPPIGIQGVHGVQGVQGLRGSGMQGSPDPPPQRSKHSARPPNQHPPAPTRSLASPLPPSNPSGGWSGQGDQEGWGLSRSASPALQGQLHDRLSLSERQPLMHPHHRRSKRLSAKQAGCLAPSHCTVSTQLQPPRSTGPTGSLSQGITGSPESTALWSEHPVRLPKLPIQPCKGFRH